MNSQRSVLRVAWVYVCVLGVAGCSGNSPAPSNAHFPSFNDITSAPTKIQTAAKAVIRVQTARETASGSFISATGELLTNNHVLGYSVCPVEGCFVQITQMHQRGSARQQPAIVFAKPVAVDVGMDMAVVQLYEQPGGSMLATPDYLNINPQDPVSLIGRHVTIVGHPEGYLKKWTDGEVVDTSGKWFTSTAYVLPGDSGSPVLDDDGNIVGLLHRAPTGEDLFAQDHVDIYSTGTASAPIAAAIAAPALNTLISVNSATTAADFVNNDLVYLNAHTVLVNADGVEEDPLSLLGQACDTALARQDFQSPDDLQTAMTPCYHANSWIDCRADASAVPYGVVCPNVTDNAAWANRWQAANQLWVNMNGQLDYYSVSFAIAHLQATENAGVSAGAATLSQALSGPKPALDFLLANYLAAFNIASYDGKTIKDYVVNYQSVTQYEIQATYAAYAGTWLRYFGLLSKDDLIALLTQLYNDANIDVGTKLYVEDYKYQMDAL